MIADLTDFPIRSSHLRAYGRSPMHGYHARTAESVSTAAMQKGTAVHAMVFKNRPVVYYVGKRDQRSKDYQQFMAENAGAEILTETDYAKCEAMAAAITSNPLAAPILEGINETTLYADWMGRKCRATPDVRGLDYICELKTCQSSDPAKFQWHSLRMHYAEQLHFQGLVCGLNGFDIQRFYIVACESSPPYPVTVFELQPRALDIAARTNMLWMERLKACESSGQYPPYAQSVVPLDVPEDEPELVFADDEENP